jgi:ferredoxin-NADP reductase
MMPSPGEAEHDLVVARKAAAADGVAAVDLRDPAGAPLPEWQPGAHIDLLLRPGLVRQYSLCGDPADRGTWRIAVLREQSGRGGSRYVHDELTEGQGVRARGPRNHFALESAGRYVFIAGGIGITPILPMIAAAEAAGADWSLIYGGRTRASMAFRDELRSRYGGQVAIRPHDETGLLDLETLLGAPAAGTLVYCCGPPALLAAVQARCAAWPEGALRVERFAPRAAGEPGGPAAAAGAFEVELAQSGRLISVSADSSILRAVEAAGIPVLSSCTEGICGTCETAVLAGVPDHRDSLLTPAERAAGDTIMICVSRSVTPRLVLDL